MIKNYADTCKFNETDADATTKNYSKMRFTNPNRNANICSAAKRNNILKINTLYPFK